MLRTLKNSPVHVPIFETGLLIRDTAQKIQQNDSVPSKMSRLPIALGQPQQSLRGETEKKRTHRRDGQSHFLTLQQPVHQLSGRGSQGENARNVKARAGWRAHFLSSKYILVLMVSRPLRHGA